MFHHCPNLLLLVTRLRITRTWLFAVSATVSMLPAAKPPLNILFVVSDDLGLQVGCYGDPAAHTPEIDRLATQSVRFATAYVTQSSCSSSRSTMLTGLFPHQNGQIGLANRGYAMIPGTRTLPAMLKAANYRTGILGKLHVNPENAFPFDFADKDVRATREVRDVAQKASRFWSKATDRPWFLMVNYFDPHVPFRDQIDGLPETVQGPEDVPSFSFQQIDTPEQRAHIAGYYNGVARVDAGLGLLLAKLKASGQFDRTIIVFMGDNGPPFVRAKTNGTAAALHVPLIIRWPGITGGDVSPALVSAADLVPTFREAAGLPPDHSLPGRSLVRLLTDPDTPFRQYLFAEHNAHRRDMYFPERIVRDARFKLILNLKPERTFGVEVDGDPAHQVLTDETWSGSTAQQALQFLLHPPREELYDLTTDPDEFHNLADLPEYQANLNRLRVALQVWRETTGDPLLDPAVSKAEAHEHTTPGS